MELSSRCGWGLCDPWHGGPSGEFDPLGVGLSVPYCELSAGKSKCKVAHLVGRRTTDSCIPLVHLLSTRHDYLNMSSKTRFVAEGRFRRTKISSYSNTGIELLDPITAANVTSTGTLGVSGPLSPTMKRLPPDVSK